MISKWWKPIAVISLSGGIAITSVGLGAWTTPNSKNQIQLTDSNQLPTNLNTNYNVQADSNALATPTFQDHNGGALLLEDALSQVDNTISTDSTIFAYPTTAVGDLVSGTDSVTITAASGYSFNAGGSSSYWTAVDSDMQTGSVNYFTDGATAAALTLTYDSSQSILYKVHLVDSVTSTDTADYYINFGTQPMYSNLFSVHEAVNEIKLNITDIGISSNFLGSLAINQIKSYIADGLAKYDGIIASQEATSLAQYGNNIEGLAVDWSTAIDASNITVADNEWLNSAGDHSTFGASISIVHTSEFDTAVQNAVVAYRGEQISYAVGHYNLLGYTKEILEGKWTPPVEPKPTDPISTAVMKAYIEKWHNIALNQLKADITAAEKAASPNLLGYTPTVLLEAFKANLPISKGELDAFAAPPSTINSKASDDYLSYENWLVAAAKTKLGLDRAAAEAPAISVGYSLETLLGSKTPPANKSEIDNFAATNLTYAQWLLQQAQEALTSDINEAYGLADALGFTINDFVKYYLTFHIPATKQQIDNFLDNQSLTEWVNKNAPLLLNQLIKQAETNAAIGDYTVDELLDGLAKPVSKQQLENFNGSGLSYQQWLANEADSKDHTKQTKLIVAIVVPVGSVLIIGAIVAWWLLRNKTNMIKNKLTSKKLNKKDKIN